MQWDNLDFVVGKSVMKCMFIKSFEQRKYFFRRTCDCKFSCQCSSLLPEHRSMT